MREMWKKINGYEKLYQISNCGQVKSLSRSTTRGGILKLNKHKSGHLYIKLCKDGKYESFQIHRLVLETFIGLCPVGMECRHLDGNPKNNRLNNLKWGTRSENVRDAIKHGKHKSPPVNAKVNIKDVPKIKIMIKKDIPILEIAKFFNLSKSIVYDIKRGKTWRQIL